MSGRGGRSHLGRATLRPGVRGEEAAVDGDVRGDRVGGQSAGQGPSLGHGRGSVQVEIRRRGISAAAVSLCDVILGADHRETANRGGRDHGLSRTLVLTIYGGVSRGRGAAPTSLFHISSVGHFRRNRNDLPRVKNRNSFKKKDELKGN